MNPPARAVPDGETVGARIDRATQRSREDPHAARDELLQVIELIDASAPTAESARAHYALARVLVSLGESESALTHIDEAEHHWRSAGEPDEAVRTNLGRMHVLDELGRHTEAVVVGRAMLDELAERDDDALVWLRAAAEENVGVALGYLGRHNDALDAYASAAASYERLGLVDDSARALANRGVELNELARPAEAIEALERAHGQFAAAGDRLWQALCQTNLSQAWITAGRYLEAFRCLDAAEAALAGVEQTTEWLRAELARASCLESLHLDIEALDIYDALIDPLTAAGLVDDLGRAQLGRGTLLGRTRSDRDIEHHTENDEALAAFDSAAQAFRTSGDDAMLAQTLLAAAALDADPGPLIAQAIDVLRGAERPAALARAHLAAAAHLECSDPAQAAAELAAATALTDALGVPDLRWRSHHCAGRLARRRGSLEIARREFEVSIDILDAVRSSLHRDGIRQHHDSAHRDAAEDLIGLLLDVEDIERALAFSESIRGRGLEERLGDPERESIDAPPDELRSIYDRLLLARGPLVTELTARARRLERHTTMHPDVSTVARDRTVELPPNTVIYQLVADEVVAFVSSPDQQIDAVRKVGEASAIEALLEQLDLQWNTFMHAEVVARHRERLESSTVDLLRRLHDAVLGPIDHLLSPDATLTVVPDGPLAAVPYAALHDGSRFLAERHPVRQTPAVRIDSLLTARTRPLRSLLALGTTDRFAPLAAAEAEHVGQLWGTSTVLVGSDARATTLFDAAAEHDVVHIAGHGLFRPDAPEFSALRLADRWVTAAELAQLRLDGQLIVLSACDTGRRTGAIKDILGLPRAFLAAGAGGVIVNLWGAADASTADLMATLHSSLATGTPAAVALRTAQLTAMADHPHPYYWAGATLVGAPAAPSATASNTTRRST